MAYMGSAVPVASDFDAPPFLKFLKLIQHRDLKHRKLWEWAFILHHFEAEGKLRPGMKGLGFGVGQEKLPSIFASRGCSIVATDGPPEIGATWAGGEYSSQKDQLFYDFIIDRDRFDALVKFQVCDMRDIDLRLFNFDFCWSACAFEHLGSLDAGIDFVMESVKTLKAGGIAIHTTEFNVGSNEETLENGRTVLYRRKDIDKLFDTATRAGHKVRPIPIEFGTSEIDRHVDAPPFSDPHLKMRLEAFVTTSIGIVIERGG
jgi:hypothetical protein